MGTREGPRRGAGDDALLALFHAIAAHDHAEVARLLGAADDLATRPLRTGASRQDPETYFLGAIGHHVYRGDTALHVAAAAHDGALAHSLVARGADVRARNRRGAEPLHYAADGSPGGLDGTAPAAHHGVIALLVRSGADPNALDTSGVGPLHRAVRNRSGAAVRALVEAGADPRVANGRGSTPLHLAVQSTGKSDAGSEAAKREQRSIITFLLGCGASPDDVDANGRTVAEAATSDWIRDLLDAARPSTSSTP